MEENRISVYKKGSRARIITCAVKETQQKHIINNKQQNKTPSNKPFKQERHFHDAPYSLLTCSGWGFVLL